MAYSAIKELPDKQEIRKLCSAELDALGKLWKEKKSEFAESGAYRQFIKKLQREWAIETGIIERLYSWDRGVTETLIEQGIDSSVISHASGINREEAEDIARIISDQQRIVDGLFAFVKGEQPFSEHFIRSMHEQFTAHQDYTEALTSDGKLVRVPLLKGKYKERANNPKRPDGVVHEYCPPELVTDEMERLVQLYADYAMTTPPEVLSAWLHHRFTQIHPFQDGNGRIARAIASLVFLKAGLFPLVIRDLDRNEYIASLEKADNGNIEPLVKLFANRQRDSILSALGIQQQVEHAADSQQIITDAVTLLKAKSTAQQQLTAVYAVADTLQNIAVNKLEDIQKHLNEQLRSIDTYDHKKYNANVTASKNGESESYYFHRQIIAIAKKYNYHANMDRYKAWSKLVICTEKIFETVFSFHEYGYGDNGIIAVSGFTFARIPSAETKTGTEPTNVKSCHQDIFQFNYLESETSIIERFNAWLDESITIALAEWQTTIG